ncbi:MAG: phospholipid carrier-dependent glycosyltransferase [Lachnospiraceae bacterium]|nr:phospholipid carrier-dependent glycosyltransferase [Lachnospiraceae bacterium]
MTKTDYIILGIITFIFTVLVFYRIGSFSAPETTYLATQDDRDIVLDLGTNIHISHAYIFLGHLDNRTFTVSAFNIERDMWDLLNGNINVASVFAWNRIEINHTLRYLGFVAMKEETYINEMIIVADDGRIILPRNASEYPGLFDEQDKFSPVYSPTYFGSTMFDEIYHGRTAYEFIHGLTTYETTHPPFGKTIISWGIRLFGMNPFGWRFFSAVFGILMLPVIYAFGKTLFRNTLAAASVTILLAADCMHFTLSRIATIDIFAAFFILLMFYLMLRYFQIDRRGSQKLLFTAKAAHSNNAHKSQRTQSGADRRSKRKLQIIVIESWVPLGLCGIIMGLGIAAKWTAIYAGAGLGLIFFWYLINSYPVKVRQLIIFCMTFFGIIPFFIYLLSYRHFVPHTPTTGLIQIIIDNTVGMFSYHADLVATHYYATPFYDWPTMRMPLLYATDPVSDTLMSSVNCMGNPAIWWVGIPCILFCILRFLWKKDLRAGFLIAAYLAQYLPWFFVSRITFIYHYFPAALFMILMIGYTLDKIAAFRPWGNKVVYAYLILAVAVFFIFYPVVSGIPFSRDYQFSLRWLPEWILVL